MAVVRFASSVVGPVKDSEPLPVAVCAPETVMLPLLPVISDTQAGFKGFRAEWAERVFQKAVINSFAFDIEALFLARRMGARIAEMPVSVEFRDESTFDVSRHLPPFIKDIYGIRLNA